MSATQEFTLDSVLDRLEAFTLSNVNLKYTPEQGGRKHWTISAEIDGHLLFIDFTEGRSQVTNPDGHAEFVLSEILPGRLTLLDDNACGDLILSTARDRNADQSGRLQAFLWSRLEPRANWLLCETNWH